MTVARLLNLSKLLEKKSFFLLGPRSTGKSTLIDIQLGSAAFVIDLLDGETFLRLSTNPSLLEEMVLRKETEGKIIAIDEIQKVPALLDQVHRLIERYKRRFLLTGSSV